MESSSSSPCAACKYLRRKCVKDCVFAPYFPQEASGKFIMVHRAFGASNVAKILNGLSPRGRRDAVFSLCFEAEVYLKDPVNGCSGYIQCLQRCVRDVNDENALLESEISQLINSRQHQPLPTNPQNFSSPETAVFQNTVYSPHPQMPYQSFGLQQVDGVFQDMVYPPHHQMLDQSFGSQQVVGVRNSGAESAAGPATVLPLAPQQIDGVRYSGAESPAGPATVLPLAPQQIDGVRYSGAGSAAGPATVLPLAPQQPKF